MVNEAKFNMCEPEKRIGSLAGAKIKCCPNKSASPVRPPTLWISERETSLDPRGQFESGGGGGLGEDALATRLERFRDLLVRPDDGSLIKGSSP